MSDKNVHSATYFDKTNMVIVGRVTDQAIAKTTGAGSGNRGIENNLDDSRIIKTIELGICTVDTSVNVVGSDHTNIGLISLDGLFCPYVINSSYIPHSGLPYWERPSGTDPTDINSEKLNPFNYQRKFCSGENFNPAGFFESGHITSLINSFEEVGSDTTGDLSIYKEMAENSTASMKNIRAVGLKAPIVVTGWGYDVDGNPVPSSGEAIHPEAFRNPNLWKSGPLDIRWDDDKKVWSTGRQYYKIRFEIHESDCTNSSAIVRILSRSYGVNKVPEEYEIINTGTSLCYTEINENGETVCSKYVQVYDKLGCFFNESNVNLTGRLGYAEYMYGHPYANYQPWTGWEVTALAEQQTECETI